MNEHRIRRILEGSDRSFAAGALRALLWLPGTLYGLVMRLRRFAYERGLFPSEASPLPVISVGNLTAGGAGKTPFTIMLARHFLDRGRKPGILLRGYTRNNSPHSDEAAMYAAACPGAVIQVDPDRRAGARAARDRGADVLLMDDGFQHLKLRRALDIVLIDALSPWGGGTALPGGLLREPTSALDRAGVIVVTRSDQVDAARLAAVTAEAARLAPRALVLHASHAPSRLTAADGTSLPLSTLAGRAVVAVSGIARPEAFRKTLESLGATVVAAHEGGDHAEFSLPFLEAVLADARQRAAAVVVTEKDRGKKIFGEFVDNNVREAVWTLGIRQEVAGAEALLELVDRAAAGPG